MPVRVLVVDDQAPFRRAAALVIASTAGFEHVGDASSGEDALALVPVLEPDLVLMDINLPGIDGVEATRRIDGDHRPVVVLVSTRALADLPSGAASCGALGYVRKEDVGPSVLRAAWDGRGDRAWRGELVDH